MAKTNNITYTRCMACKLYAGCAAAKKLLPDIYVCKKLVKR